MYYNTIPKCPLKWENMWLLFNKMNVIKQIIRDHKKSLLIFNHRKYCEISGKLFLPDSRLSGLLIFWIKEPLFCLTHFWCMSHTCQFKAPWETSVDFTLFQRKRKKDSTVHTWTNSFLNILTLPIQQQIFKQMQYNMPIP